MEHPVRLGVELAVARGVAFDRMAESAARVAAAGFDAVWISGHPDPCTLAGALATRPAPPLLGVVAEVPAGRHPAVLARELTGLDVVSGGRAALLVRWRLADGVPAPPDPVGYLDEAVEVYRRVCTDEVPEFEGVYLRVAGARNRPGPSRPGGPPVVVEPPAGWGAVPGAAAVLVGTDAVARARRALDGREGPGRTTLLWRAPPTARAPHVRAARDAGADGMVVTVEAGEEPPALDVLAGAWSG